jgi:hypothetical protein
LQHAGLGAGIQGRGRLVEHQHRRRLDDRPGDRQPLPLPARHPRAPWPRHGLIAVWQFADELVGLGDRGRRLHFGVGGVQAAIANVLADAGVKEHRFLQHRGDLAAAAGRVEVPHRVPVEADGSVAGVVVAE